MATYSNAIAVHETLSASTVDTITLTTVNDAQAMIVNRTGTAEIYGTIGYDGTTPVDPTVAGAGTFVLPASICALSLDSASGPIVVKLISSGEMAYSVHGY